MCFSPQRRAIFGHLNYQKWPESVVFSTFWLTNMLRATAACHFWTSERPKWVRDRGVLCILPYKCASRHSACNFWTSQLPKWLRPCGVLCILTCKCAFRHSRVPFFTCPRKSYLRTRRFSEPTFRTSGTTIHWENTAIRDFTNIFRACWTACERLYAHVDLLASDLTDVDLLATDMTAVRLCFSTLHIVGS